MARFSAARLCRRNNFLDQHVCICERIHDVPQRRSSVAYFKQYILAVGAVGLLAFAAACGGQTAPQPPDPNDLVGIPVSKTSPTANGESGTRPVSSVVCESTLELALEHPILAARGVDPIPSGFDAANNTTSRYDRPIVSVTLELRMDDRVALTHQVVLDPPVAEVRFPLGATYSTPIPGDLAVGGYGRAISVTDVDGKVKDVRYDAHSVWLLDPAGVDMADARKAIVAARQELSNERGIPYAALTLLAFEPFEWSDASLGCAEPGQMYAEVVTPGFMMVFEYQGLRYEYHTDQDGSRTVKCRSGPPSTTPPTHPPVFFIREDETVGPSETMAALLIGRPVAADGCLRLNASEGDASYLPIWPPGFMLVIENDSIDLLNPRGELVARVGDKMRVDGGEVLSRESQDEPLQRKLTQTHCPGPYWVVGDAEVATRTNTVTEAEGGGDIGEAITPGPSVTMIETDALRQDAQQYAEDFGVDVEEAMRRLALQDPIGELNATLTARESDTFGGLWVEHEPECKVVVLFTRNGEETLRPLVEGGPLADIVEVRIVEATMAELIAVQSETSRIIDRLGIAVMSGVDVKGNRVEIRTTDVAGLARALSDAGVQLPLHVELIAVSALASPESVPTASPDALATITPVAPQTGPPAGDCQGYLELTVSGNGQAEEAVVTYYRCGAMYVDSTGRSPSRTPSISVSSDALLSLSLGADQPPTLVEIRLYVGTGKSGWFGRWPDELPGGEAPADTRKPSPAVDLEYDPAVPPGEYSLVVRAIWSGLHVDVFYATSIRVD